MKKTYRMSLERHNAPFRGISSREDSTNFDLATLHDLVHLEKISGGNILFRGHKQKIKDNLSSLYYGEGEITSTIPTAGKLVSVIGPIEGYQDLSLWTPTSGAVVAKAKNKFTISSTGLLVPAGIVTLIEANPGDIISLRFKIKRTKGQGTILAFGAEDFDDEGNNFSLLNLSQFSTSQYVEKRLYCTSRKDIKVVLYSSYETNSGVPTEIIVEDFSINLMQETTIGAIGTDSVIKLELEKDKRALHFLEQRITTNKKEGKKW